MYRRSLVRGKFLFCHETFAVAIACDGSIYYIFFKYADPLAIKIIPYLFNHHGLIIMASCQFQ